jgi:hypothetical protein
MLGFSDGKGRVYVAMGRQCFLFIIHHSAFIILHFAFCILPSPVISRTLQRVPAAI